MAELLFYLLSAGALAFGVGVVTAKMPLFSVLSLLGTFFCLAGIYLLAGFQFLAATQLLVYAGAIMVLFLFVIMLLNLGDPAELRKSGGLALGKGRLVVASAAALALAVAGMVAVSFGGELEGAGAPPPGGLDAITPLAEVLFSRYALAFEAASLLLLATMIAVVVLAKRQRGGADTSAATAADAGEGPGWPWREGVEP